VENHPFVLDHKSPPLLFTPYRVGGKAYIEVHGDIHCQRNIILSVTKHLETRPVGEGGRIQVRGLSYRYNASLQGKHEILRYDNTHSTYDYYHKHLFDPVSGTELDVIPLTREEFPVCHQVLDEIMEIAYRHQL